MPKRTLQKSKAKRRSLGFRTKMKTKGGRRILKSRRDKNK